MRTLLVGTVSTTLMGCSCLAPPHASVEWCPSKACFDQSANRAPIELPPVPLMPHAATTTKSKSAAKLVKSRSEQRGSRAGGADENGNSPAAPAPDQRTEVSDSVLIKAKSTIAKKMEDPVSAEFADMNRATRKNTLGQPVDTICGHVKGKKTSGEDTGERPFLYLVKEDEAYVVDGNADSAAAIAYRNICTSADARGKDLRQRQKRQ
jgi:hypothetical protein